MKNLKLTLLSLFALVLTSCGEPCACEKSNEPTNDTRYIVQLHFMDGSLKADTFMLPSTTSFWVEAGQNGSSGTYTLMYRRRAEGDPMVLKPAVIDFEVTDKFRIDTTSQKVQLVE